MKKTLIASLAVLTSAVVAGTFALGGAGKFGDVQVHANAVEYSATFDENASCQEVAIEPALTTFSTQQSIMATGLEWWAVPRF